MTAASVTLIPSVKVTLHSTANVESYFTKAMQLCDAGILTYTLIANYINTRYLHNVSSVYVCVLFFYVRVRMLVAFFYSRCISTQELLLHCRASDDSASDFAFSGMDVSVCLTAATHLSGRGLGAFVLFTIFFAPISYLELRQGTLEVFFLFLNRPLLQLMKI